MAEEFIDGIRTADEWNRILRSRGYAGSILDQVTAAKLNAILGSNTFQTGQFLDASILNQAFPVVSDPILALFQSTGYGGDEWVMQPQYLYSDAAATTAAAINGPVSAWQGEVNNILATAANTAASPTYAGSSVNWDASDDLLTATLPTTSAQGVLGVATPYGYQVVDGVNLSGTYNLPGGDMSAIAAIQGSLTATQLASLKQGLASKSGRGEVFFAWKVSGTKIYTQAGSHQITAYGANGKTTTFTCSGRGTFYDTANDGLTAPVVYTMDLAAKTDSSLTAFYADYNNGAIGCIPDLSALTSLQYFNIYNNQLTGTIPDLSALTSLQTLNLYHNQLTGTIPDLSALTSLYYLHFGSNQLTGYSGTAISASCTSIDLTGNALTQSAIDAILTQLDSAGASNGTVKLSGGTNASPSSTGQTAVTNLQGKGWTVTTN